MSSMLPVSQERFVSRRSWFYYVSKRILFSLSPYRNGGVTSWYMDSPPAYPQRKTTPT
ncbi:hypothetical protein DPMN_112245 [Dreissena polymorpha]|uniref:Uncharacterized protein n=1 Tax=Dreissena polymorpha TaxID=45954 RepID=A0A9D4QQP7_DREPO|nr:hypothetical protein DPMN_112245 [Dreissena polymorpha]